MDYAYGNCANWTIYGNHFYLRGKFGDKLLDLAEIKP